MAMTGTYIRTANPTTRKNRPLEEVQAEKPRRKLGKLPRIQLRIRSLYMYLIGAVVLVLILASVNSYQKGMPIRDIHVLIHSEEDNQFVVANDVKEMLGLGEEREIIGLPMERIALRELEAELNALPSIQHAEVYKSLGAVLQVEVTVRKPVARLVNNDGTMLYMDVEGHKFPTSKRHSARVVLVRGDFQEEVVDTFACNTIEAAIPVLDFIQHDPFWNAQVSEVVVQQSGALLIYPQIGDIYIEFGQPVRIEEKFENLRLFYNQVVKEVGWRKYKGVSVVYRGQVVAKKR
jgi:cell division protein FtsQ